jgi:hypothetical protein
MEITLPLSRVHSADYAVARRMRARLCGGNRNSGQGSQTEIYQTAWHREPGGKLLLKTHLIDAPVEMTRQIVVKAAEREARHSGMRHELERGRVSA